jgi:hypothetical protein
VENQARERPSGGFFYPPFASAEEDIGAHDRRIDYLNEVGAAAHLGQISPHGPISREPQP